MSNAATISDPENSKNSAGTEDPSHCVIIIKPSKQWSGRNMFKIHKK